MVGVGREKKIPNLRPAGRSKSGMQRTRVIVPWSEGLHLRHAIRLVRAGQQFHSTICLKCGDRMADLRSILSVLALCAAMGATLDLEASGDDEQEAARSVARLFSE